MILSAQGKSGTLLDLRDYQMCRNRTGTAGQRSDCQSCCGSFGVAHSQNRVCNRCFHNRHADNLGDSRSATGNGIWQIFAIQGQNQLPCFGHTHLEQNLIGADFYQIKGTGAGTGDAGTAVGPILGEADIRTGRDGGGVIRRH